MKIRVAGNKVWFDEQEGFGVFFSMDELGVEGAKIVSHVVECVNAEIKSLTDNVLIWQKEAGEAADAILKQMHEIGILRTKNTNLERALDAANTMNKANLQAADDRRIERDTARTIAKNAEGRIEYLEAERDELNQALIDKWPGRVVMDHAAHKYNSELIGKANELDELRSRMASRDRQIEYERTTRIQALQQVKGVIAELRASQTELRDRLKATQLESDGQRFDSRIDLSRRYQQNIRR